MITNKKAHGSTALTKVHVLAAAASLLLLLWQSDQDAPHQLVARSQSLELAVRRL
jgi:hypothetical protein